MLNIEILENTIVTNFHAIDVEVGGLTFGNNKVIWPLESDKKKAQGHMIWVFWFFRSLPSITFSEIFTLIYFHSFFPFCKGWHTDRNQMSNINH